MITAVAGVRVGHWTDPVARTGCTVALLPAGTVASGEVRGGAPGTREWALLDPRRSVDAVNAVVLAGGSAFGLAACDGAMRWCEERGIGWPTPAGPVPIVVGMVIYDLMVGDPSVRPDAAAGYAACVAARAGGAEIAGEGVVSAGVGGVGVVGGASVGGAGVGGAGVGGAGVVAAGPGGAGVVAAGPVGAGTGATVGKWRGGGQSRPAGLGSAVHHEGDLVVAALVVVNAVGDLRTGDGPRFLPAGAGPVADTGQPTGGAGTNTTIGLVVTNARLDKVACRKVAESGHDGLARALDPVHTGADGDALVAAATGAVAAPVDTVRGLATWVVEQAVVAACRSDAPA